MCLGSPLFLQNEQHTFALLGAVVKHEKSASLCIAFVDGSSNFRLFDGKNGSIASLLVYDSIEDVGEVEIVEHSEFLRLLIVQSTLKLSDHS